jgi:hypothetical protein
MNAEDVVDEVIEVVEENGAYYNFGSDGWERYAPDPHVLEALGYIITAIVLPILTSVISDELEERLKLWKRTRRAVKPTDIQDAIEQAAAGAKPTLDARAAAVDAVASLLREHGWPAQEAGLDAESIVERISRSLWGDD